MKKTKIFNIAAISALVLAAGAGTALASSGNLATGVFMGRHNGNGPKAEVNSQFRTQIEAAMESGDYNAWKEAMGDKGGRMAEVITADNFSQFVEAWKLEKAGDKEGAQKIRESLGLGHPEGAGFGGKHGNRMTDSSN